MSESREAQPAIIPVTTWESLKRFDQNTRLRRLDESFNTRLGDRPADGLLRHEPNQPRYDIVCTPRDRDKAARVFSILIHESGESATLSVGQISDRDRIDQILGRESPAFQAELGYSVPNADDMRDFNEIIKTSFIGGRY